VLGNGHAGFGRRPGETHQWQHRQGAPGRPHRHQGKCPIPATICLDRRRINVLYALIRDNRIWQPDSPPITTAAA